MKWDSQLFKDRKATIVALNLSSHNLPTSRARQLFNPLKIREVF